MGNWCSTTNKGPGNNSSNVTMIHRDNPKKALHDNKNQNNFTDVMVTSEYNTMVLGASNSGDIALSGNTATTREPTEPTVVLLPHQHTLFCERKQRVCTAVGRCQELEKLKIAGLDINAHNFVWFRSSTKDTVTLNKDRKKHLTLIPHSENLAEYTLQKEDVDSFVGVLFAPKNNSKSNSNNSSFKGQSLLESDTARLSHNVALGPVLPGPPRILNFTVSGEQLSVGHYAKAETQYIGGSEGRSEFWWMRISSDGKRTQVTQPKTAPVPQGKGYLEPDVDPRLYRITEADVGCTLKAKCRPVRFGDNAQGEIFTSKSSETIRK